jgi:hypothetical protein
MFNNYTTTLFPKTALSDCYEIGNTSTLFVIKYGFQFVETSVAPWSALTDLVFTAGGTAFVNGSVFTLYGLP